MNTVSELYEMYFSLNCHFTISVHDSWSRATLLKRMIISVQKVMKVT